MGGCQGRVVTCVIPNGAGIKQEGSQSDCYALTEITWTAVTALHIYFPKTGLIFQPPIQSTCESRGKSWDKTRWRSFFQIVEQLSTNTEDEDLSRICGQEEQRGHVFCGVFSVNPRLLSSPPSIDVFWLYLSPNQCVAKPANLNRTKPWTLTISASPHPPEKPSKQLRAEIVSGDSISCNSTHPSSGRLYSIQHQCWKTPQYDFSPNKNDRDQWYPDDLLTC